MKLSALALSVSLALAAGAPAALAQDGADAAPDAVAKSEAKAKQLVIGDEMPALDYSGGLEWELGEPVTEWEEGHVYVVDFWATWCGPCIASMPHLIELQDKYEEQDVQVVAVHIWANPRSASVEEFISSGPDRGLDFNYPIVRETGDWAATTYMDTTGNRSIPTVMVVNQEGRLAWHGHPNDLDPVLAAVVDGEWDLDSAAEEARAVARRNALQQRGMQVISSPEGQAIYARLQEAAGVGDFQVMADTLEELIALDEEALAIFRADQYQLVAIELGDAERAREVGEAFLASPYAEDAEMLNMFAWQIVDPGAANAFANADAQDSAFALKLADRAAALSDRENPDILDTLARAQFLHGDTAAALTTQREAVELAEAEEYDELLIDSLRESLDEYEAAAEEAKSAS